MRLARTGWRAGLDDVGWDDGANPAYMRHLATWWRSGFDWRVQEAALNTFAHIGVAAETNSGYAHIQRTKPQTLAFGLADSPVGLAAWIVDRYQSWSDCSGDVERRFSKDDLLTVVTLYWATQTIGSSFRIFREWALASALTPGAHEVYPDAPTGADATPFGPGERIALPAAIVLPRADNSPPREWAERAYDLRRWTELPRGGHFLAFEEPTLLVEELRAFFRPLR